MIFLANLNNGAYDDDCAPESLQTMEYICDSANWVGI